MFLSLFTDVLLASTGIQFIGPFAVLSALHQGLPAPEADAICASSRFTYDPPELCAIAWFPASSPRHWAFYTDDPAVPASMVVESDAKRGNTFTPMSGM